MPQPINPGDIVAFATHHYFPQITSVIFAGDPLQQSPLMIAVEKATITPNKKALSQVPYVQWNCYWYSPTSNKFESAWIRETLLKVIYRRKDEEMNFAPDTMVHFRTLPLELPKKKSTLSTTSGSDNTPVVKMTALLSYISPTMVVIGDVGVPMSPNKQNEVARQIDPALIKVAWFNYQGDKVSETILPVICLEPVPIVNETHLQELQRLIKSREYIQTVIDGEPTFLHLLGLHSTSGIYTVRARNFLTDEIIDDMEISSFNTGRVTANPIIDSAPVFDFSKSSKAQVTVEALLRKCISEKKVVRISYNNQHNIFSKRCLRNLTLSEVTENEQKVFYLKGFCLTKKDWRDFNVTRISRAEMIALEYRKE